MSTLDLESLVVTVGFFGSLAGATFALSENKRRLLKSTGESFTFNPYLKTLKPGTLGLCLNQQPKDITKGFVFGSDPASCDVLLAKLKDFGISGNHFSVHFGWISRDTIVTCLSGNDLLVNIYGVQEEAILSRNKWLRLPSGTAMDIRVTQGLGVMLYNPDRKELQATYNRNLQDYFLEFKNAVPELANISLRDIEVTPLILYRCPGLEGKEYYAIGKIETGDHDYDTKVFLYNAKRRRTADAGMTTEEKAETQAKYPKSSSHANKYEDMEDWLSSHTEGVRPGELCIVKHFQKKQAFTDLPHHVPELCRLRHLNLEDLMDFISEPLAFMTVTDIFSHMTLHELHQEQRLSTEEAGFVIGQIFSALEYLHARGWSHGNLDPRSIQVMSRQRLWIKLTDVGLSGYIDLGKPDGYHTHYASQRFMDKDKSPADIWSAGVVALHLLLPDGLPHMVGADANHVNWMKKVVRLAVSNHKQSGTIETAFVRSVLKHEIKDRPTATKALGDPWIVQTRGEVSVNNPHYNPSSPQRSRHTSVGPSDAPSRQGDATPESSHKNAGPSHRSSHQNAAASSSTVRWENAPGSRHTSVGPSRHSSRHGSIHPSESASHRDRHYPPSRAPSRNLSGQRSTHPTLDAVPDDEWDDFDSEPGTQTSRTRKPDSRIPYWHHSSRSELSELLKQPTLEELVEQEEPGNGEHSGVKREPDERRSR